MLVFAPFMLALRVWLWPGDYRSLTTLRELNYASGSNDARDYALGRQAKKVKNPEIIWDIEELPATPKTSPELRAAE